MNDEENPQPAPAGADDFIARIKAGVAHSAARPTARGGAAPQPSPAPNPAPTSAAAAPFTVRQMGVPTLTTATPVPGIFDDRELLDLIEQEVRELRTDFTFPVPVATVPVPPKTRTVACVVTHGMGQQVPFQTAAQVAEAFMRGRAPKGQPQVNRVPLVAGGDLVSRMELHYEAEGDEGDLNVHIYEGYWAPLTEGKITYTSLMTFLAGAFLDGVKALAGKGFDRWIFGNLRKLPLKRHTAPMLLATGGLLVLLAIFIALALYSLHPLFTALKAFAAYTPLDAVEVIWQKCRKHPWKAALFAITPFAAALAAGLRWLLVEYLGDVVIYVSSYKVSVYEEVRTAIQKRVLDLAKQVVAHSDPLQPLDGEKHGGNLVYDGLVFVGHSLGSVVTYDTVNALITWDAQGCQGRYNLLGSGGKNGRILRLLTFGSPLDKTAFLFRTQIERTEHHFREAMAANMQPLVLDYAFRTFPWINLHSHLDPVSGALAYYDVPDGPGADPTHRVVNKTDPACTIYAWAHGQYWDGALLSEELLEAVGLKVEVTAAT